MSRWGLALVAIMLGIAAWGLPPRPYPVSGEWALKRTPEREAFLSLQEEILQENWLFQRIQWRDSLTSLLHERWEAGEPYAVGAPGWVEDSIPPRLALGVRLHLRSRGGSLPLMPVGVFLVPKGESAHPEAPDHFGFMWNLQEYYVARKEEAPFCYLVSPVDEEGANGVNQTVRYLVAIPGRNPASDPNPLRICSFFARYGNPGDGIMKWLRGGAFRLGTGVDRDRYLGAGGPLRGAFGRRAPESRYAMDVSPRGLSCLGQEPEACRAIFLSPDDGPPYWGPSRAQMEAYMSRSPVDFLAFRRWSGRDFGSFEEFMFLDLETEFGAESFREFWTSDQAVGESFQKAFGEPAGEWLMGWARSHYGETVTGPGVPARATLFTFLSLGILAGGAVYMARR